MATRKPKNPELAAAAKNLIAAARHTRNAINRKLDEIGVAASSELNKAKQSALTQSGRARRQFDALVRNAQGRLKKATAEAKRSLQKAVGDAEKTLEGARTAIMKKVPAKKTAAKKSTARRAPARKAAARKAPARKPAA